MKSLAAIAVILALGIWSAPSLRDDAPGYSKALATAAAPQP